MSFINNPLGSGGFSPQVLPNMAEGVIALQRTEQQRLLDEIKQNKQWERDDRLKNQALALQFSDVGTYDSLRQQQIDSFLKKKDNYIAKAASIFSSGKTPDTKDLMMLQTERQKLLNETMQERAFTEAFQKMQGQAPALRKSLETQAQRDQFDKQIADFTLRLKDPKQKVETYDLIQAFSPPEPPTSYLLSQTTKQLLPLVDSAVMDAGNGTTKVDPNKLYRGVAANLGSDDYLFEKGKQEGLWQTKEEMFQGVAERLAPSIKTDVSPWQPRVGGGGSGSLAKRQELYPTTIKTETGKEEQVFNFPQQLSRVPRKYQIGDAIDPETGKTIPINDEVDLNVVSFNKEKGTIRAEMAGGEVKRNGKPVLVQESALGIVQGKTIKDKMASGKTDTELEANAYNILKDKGQSKEWSNVENVSIERNPDGSYSLNGDLVLYEGFMGRNRDNSYKPKPNEKPTKTERVSVTYYPITDEKEKKTIELPISEYRNMLSPLEKSYKVGDKTLTEFLDESGTPTQEQQIPTYSRQELKAMGYSDSQIDNGVKNNKIKLK